MKNCTTGSRWGRSLMDFLVSLVGRTLLNLKTFLDGTEMMEDSLYEGQMCYIPEEVKEDKNFVEKIVYVSPIRHAEGNFYLSQILAYPEMYEQMLQVLKEYDEDIISINYDDNERRIGKGTYKILSKSNKKALPLNVYGDGMKKAILLMSAVIAAKDGILLLDEFKTAIHTSAMNKTFKWIIESCKKLNVQVFMTSHSKEAIDKVLKCSTECIDVWLYIHYTKIRKVHQLEDWMEKWQLKYRMKWDWS